jgi:hypothetical protein
MKNVQHFITERIGAPMVCCSQGNVAVVRTPIARQKRQKRQNATKRDKTRQIYRAYSFFGDVASPLCPTF